MYDLYNRRLAEFRRHEQQQLLRAGLMGLEKESLRVSPGGTIAQTGHPTALGSALTHPHVTTDYSEALLELITSPHASVPQMFGQLDEIVRVVYATLEDEEILWATSMPCVVEGETSIPIARYGSSNSGMMKHVYRHGLAHRYGKTMQVIAGVHFNHSFAPELWPVFAEIAAPDPRHSSKSESYMSLTRNLLRLGWLVPYLFGASPAVCKSFFGNRESPFQAFDASTAYEPYATSLRLSDIGYQNNREAELGISIDYSSLDRYIESLREAITRPHAEYERIGVKVNGEYRQLNANLLQIENEYYSTVRAKEIAQRLEKPTTALARRGVRYVELRSPDVSPFDALGVNEPQLQFLKLFMTFCLLQDSPVFEHEERRELRSNLQQTAIRGRDPALNLHRCGKKIALRDWATELLEQMQGLAELLDSACPQTPFTSTLAEQMHRVQDPEATPSARVLREMRDHGESFFEFAMRVSHEHERGFRARPVDSATTLRYQEMAQQSLRDQAQVEAADEIDFDTFLAEYFSETA